jgi:hypothetical protein
MSKWPYPYSEDKPPPEKIYLGFDEEKGKILATWWVWPTMSDDVVYIRKDIVDKKLKELKNGNRKDN